MSTLPFPQSQPSLSSTSPKTNQQAQKKDIAALLSNHVQPNPSMTVTLSDPSGKTASIECNTGDPVQLLGLAINYLSC